jgi:hypothetical protein
VKKIMEEVGIELERTEEIEDLEEFIVLNNKNKNLNKSVKKRREKERKI